MREDIVGGLRNALERGTSLEQAIRSFMNAGYREADVRDAAKLLEGGAITFSLQQPTRNASLSPAVPQRTQSFKQPMQVAMKSSFEVQRPRQRPSMLIIVLSVVLLLSITSFVFSLMFKKEIAELLTRLLAG